MSAAEIISTAAQLQAELAEAEADRAALFGILMAVDTPTHNRAVAKWCGETGTPRAVQRFRAYVAAMLRMQEEVAA